MRILLAHMQFGRSYRQGGERYVATLTAGLRRRGHDVRILAGDPLHLDSPRTLGEPFDQEQQLYAYPSRGWMAVQGIPPERFLPLLKQWRPDIVHLNTAAHIGAGLALAAKRLHIPLVVTVHDFWWTCPKGTLLCGDGSICDGKPAWPQCIRCIAADHESVPVHMLARLPVFSSSALLLLSWVKAAARGMPVGEMRRWLHRREFLAEVLALADAVICPSVTARDVLRSGGKKGRWEVVRNGIAPDWFADPRPRSAQVKSPAELCVGFAGALAPHKGPHLLLEAVNQLGWREARVRMAGPAAVASYADRLRKAAASLNVEFAGNLDAEAMRAFLRSLDILAITSVWLENCPYVVLEAQAAGVTVVGPDRGGVAELISDPRLQFTMGSGPALAQALEYARTHPVTAGGVMVPTEAQMTHATEELYQSITIR